VLTAVSPYTRINCSEFDGEFRQCLEGPHEVRPQPVGSNRTVGESAAERNLMQFVSDYMKAIDFIALAALVVIAVASLYRAGTVWLLIAAIVVAIWGISRLFGLF
jgi:hypothetical protein